MKNKQNILTINQLLKYWMSHFLLTNKLFQLYTEKQDISAHVYRVRVCND